MTTAVAWLIVAVVCFAAVALIAWIAQGGAYTRRSLPPLIYPLRPPSPSELANGNGRSHRAETVVERQVAVEPPRVNHRRTPIPPHADTNDNAETVRFVRQTDQAVQILPGRLEVIAGATPLREIRFVRVPGEPDRVILGREPGPSPQHIGLGSATVSRLHARFDFTDQRWNVKNLSRTNPLVVNDDELSDSDAARPLADGDRLELGEVVLRFHAH
ncbi:MAG TPA: FHA domain-containing protein [Gemmatimonadaceae bacterium]